MFTVPVVSQYLTVAPQYFPWCLSGPKCHPVVSQCFTVASQYLSVVSQCHPAVSQCRTEPPVLQLRPHPGLFQSPAEPLQPPRHSLVLHRVSQYSSSALRDIPGSYRASQSCLNAPRNIPVHPRASQHYPSFSQSFPAPTQCPQEQSMDTQNFSESPSTTPVPSRDILVPPRASQCHLRVLWGHGRASQSFPVPPQCCLGTFQCVPEPPALAGDIRGRRAESELEAPGFIGGGWCPPAGLRP